MSNTILTPTAVTREAMRILHEKATFIGNVNRQYDSSFAVSGAKIGSTLKVRLPNQYTVRTGKTINVQDTTEASETITVATQKGVDMNFSSAELTLEMDDFSQRILEPAMSVLVSDIEADCLQDLTQEVYNQVGTVGTVPNAMSMFGNARARLNQYLAPKNGRKLQVNSMTMSSMVDTFKGLFQDSAQIKEQYREGMIGRTAGFDWYENERVYIHTNGADVAGTIDGDTLANGDAELTATGLSAAPSAGTIFSFSGIKAVHPETKTSYAHDQQFVVLAGSTTTTIYFSPAIYSSGPKQNVSAMPGTTATISFVGSLSTAYAQDLAYHPDFATVVFADLEDVSKYGVWCAREQLDGVSIRIARQYDVNNDNVPTRIDILYGKKMLRPQLACRITS